MTKGQFILVISGLLLMALLFVFGSRTTTTTKVTEAPSTLQPSEPIQASQIRIDLLTERLKNKLPKTQQDSLAQLEQKLKEATDKRQKVHLLETLAIKWQKNRYAEIAAYYKKAIAQVDSTLQNWEKAAEYLGDAFRISEDSTMRQYLLTNSIVAYQKALKFDPDNIELKTALGACYIDGFGGNPQRIMEGVFLLRDVVQEDSTNVDANLLLGRMAIFSGQLDKAIQRLSLVTQEDETNAEAFYYLGETYFALQEKEKAIEAFRACKKLIKNPTFAAELDQYIKLIND